MRNFISLCAGGLFGAGLYVSGMTNTDKIRGWLDLLGDWDPTLAFVMGGAIIPMFFAWRWTAGRAPVLGGTFPAKPDAALGRPLIVGSILFGTGWGLSGLCPGPAMASITFGHTGGLIFFIAMIAGMFFAPWGKRALEQSPSIA